MHSALRSENADLCREIERLRATLLNIQALAERGNPVDSAKLAARCHRALNQQQADR
jgi:hypothetical protein